MEGVPPEAGRSARGEEELIERSGELDALEASVMAAAAGEGSLLVIEGHAGLGKSRLMTAVTDEARRARMLLLRARPGRFERDFPFGVVRQLFEPVLAGLSPGARAELFSGAAGLAAPLFDDRQPAAALSIPDDAAYPTLHGLHWLTVNLATRRPVLVVVDDAHWADVDSLRWLAYLSRRIEGVGVLVAAAERPGQPDERGRLIDELAAEQVARVLRPAPLSEQGSAAFIRRELDGHADEAFCRSCHDATGGNPFFLGELVSELAADRVAARGELARRVPEVGPQTVARAVLRRLGTLPFEPLALARAVAILGDDVELRQAAALADLEPTAAAACADRLARVEIFRAGQPLAFAHPIVRTAIYHDLPGAERARDHSRAAQLLREHGAPPDRIAAHLLESEPAGDPETVAALRDAAGRAEARGATASAVPYLRRALAEPPSEDKRGEVLAELGAAEIHVDPAAAVRRLEEALAGAGDARRRAQLALLLSRALILSNRLGEAVELLQRAIAEVGTGDSQLALRLEAELITQARLDRSTLDIARERLARVRAEALGPGAPTHTGEAAVAATQTSEAAGPLTQPAEAAGPSTQPAEAGRLLLACLAGETANAGESADAAADLALRSLAGGGLDDENPLAFTFAVSVLTWADRFEEASRAFEEALRDARARGSAPAVALLSGWRSTLALRGGAVGDAEQDARTALEIAAPEAWGPSIALPLAFLLDALVERGELEEAAEALEHHRLADDLPDNRHANLLLASRGALRAAQGDARGAVDDLRRAGARLEDWGIRNPAVAPWRSLLALALAELGEGEEAEALALSELEAAKLWGAPLAIARALRAAGTIADDAEMLQEALAVLDGSPAALERARVLVELGAVLRRAGSPAQAREPLRQALEIAHRNGALVLAERGHEELIATGARPRRTALTGVASLTPSERRVASLAADALTNRQIAETLFVTEKTVELHLSATYKKLDIRSRSQLPPALATAGPTAVGA